MKLNPWGMVIDPPGNIEQGDQDTGSTDLC